MRERIAFQPRSSEKSVRMTSAASESGSGLMVFSW
jgi:hypothetical protein